MKILWILFIIDSFLTHIVFSQYSNNDGYNQRYNQMSGENEPSTEYMRNQFDDFNQQKSQSYQSEYKEMPMPYQFEYNTDDGYGNKQDRQEKADEFGNVIGSYGYMDSNGVYRKVEYTAGPEGFKARINSNEPYLKNNANPAHVMLFVEDPPQSVLDYWNKQRNSYSRDEQMNERHDDLMSNQIKEQDYRASDQPERGANRAYTKNDNNGFGRMRPFLNMIKPQYNNRNSNQNVYQSMDSMANPMETHNRNRNLDEIQAYASDRRYYD